MKKALLATLLGVFFLSSLPAQVKHRLIGPRAKNEKFWREKKTSYEPVASLNGRIVPGRTKMVRRGADRVAPPRSIPRITGPRAKNTPVRDRRNASRSPRRPSSRR